MLHERALEAPPGGSGVLYSCTMTRPSIAFLGLGSALPERVRTSADPIFDRIREAARAQGLSEASLFYGNREHRCLAPGESLASLTGSGAGGSGTDVEGDEGEPAEVVAGTVQIGALTIDGLEGVIRTAIAEVANWSEGDRDRAEAAASSLLAALLGEFTVTEDELAAAV